MIERATWLLKTLWEATGELEGLVLSAYEAGAADRPPPPDALSLPALTGRLRDQETITVWRLEQLIEASRPRLRLHPLEWLEPERTYRSRDVGRLLQEFQALRGRTGALLWPLEPSEWGRTAEHPFMGAVSIERLVTRLHAHDLETAWNLRALRDGALAQRR